MKIQEEFPVAMAACAEKRLPRNPDYAALVQERFAQQKPMQLIGASLQRVEPGYVEISVPCTENIMSIKFANYVHGGIIGMIADSAMGFAGLTMAEPEAVGVTAEYKISMIAAAVGDEVVACGRTIRTGNRVTVTSAEIFAVRNGDRKLVAMALGTLIPTGVRADSH
jgi:uncharacterized protein (TIGR00369 family)